MENKEKNKEKKNKTDNKFMINLSTFIVDKRNLFFLIFIIVSIFCVISMNWRKVENSLPAFLPSSSQTSKGLTIMEQEFITYGTAEVMVDNISFDEANSLKMEIEGLDYVAMVQYDTTSDHYNNFAALYTITFRFSEKDERCLNDLEKLKNYLGKYETYVSTTMGNQESEAIDAEMKPITIIVAVIVVAVLLFTSTSYAEVPVLILTFVASAALAKGTNFWLGTISFVSDSVAIVLQLALSVDYAVIFLNRYKDEHQRADAHTATILALSKAIVEITASSLTTVGGLIAMMFMQFGIGPDLAVVLIKAIVLSLLSVFLLMPGLIIVFSNAMDKTVHRSFIPKIPFVGKFAYATRFVIPIIFVIGLVFAFRLQNKIPFVYGYSQLSTEKQNEASIINQKIDDTFTSHNMVAVIVPGHNYDKEKEFLDRVDAMDEVYSEIAIANTEAREGITLVKKLNSREFASMVDMDTSLTDLLYAAYAVSDENYTKLVSGIENYRVALIDMVTFLYQEIADGLITVDDEIARTIEEQYGKIKIAKDQLIGTDYDRMLLYLNLPEEGTETFEFLDKLVEIGREIYGEDANILVAGQSTSQYDLKKTFDVDNTVVSIVSILAVLIVLLFTFKSAGMPVLLIAIIQGCIWINFAVPALTDNKLFFMGYLIVSSIQMGANIDYAIVVSGRYQEVKKLMSKKEAIIDSMNFAFPTIITSGTMLAAAGIIIGKMTSDPSICGIGQCLGRGTIISILVVMFVLPQVLLLGDKIIDRTSFEVTIDLPISNIKQSGTITVSGPVKGRIDGEFIGTMRGIIRGNVELTTRSGRIEDAENKDGIKEFEKIEEIEEIEKAELTEEDV